MDAQARLSARLSDRYVFDREIGAGGMATVYLARDVKHNRKVALKVLRPDIGAALGVDRFLSEIQVTANLQHPNLLPLFDSGEADGLLFYVMPFVEGESLRAMLERDKQLPIDEAIRITTAVASALDYAHAQGVIHRDLKPENILVHAGQPVIADFGIALAVSNAGGARITQTGISLGTPQYMSPEQATGDRNIDRRTDIYSLGAIAYEMLTGEPPHAGTTAQAIIARVLTEAPRSARVTRPNVPEHVDAAVLCALEKLPADRWPTAAEFAAALGAGAHQPRRSHLASAGQRRAGWRGAVMDWRIWAVAAVAASAWGVVESRRVAAADARQRVARFALDVPPGSLAIALSHDGRRLVYVGRPHSDPTAPPRLYVRELDQLASTEIPGTIGASSPQFSSDGATVFFWLRRRLLRVAVGGGTPVTVVDSLDAGPVGVSESGIILLDGTSGIYEVSGGGGKPDAVYEAPGYEVESPVRLPGASDFLFVGCPHPGWCAEDERELFTITRGARARRVIAGFQGIQRLRYLDGHLVYLTADHRLRAVRFDARRLSPVGQAVIVDDQVARFDVSQRGDLVTVWGNPGEGDLFVWEPGGATRALPTPRRFYTTPVVSPDGRSIAAEVEGPGRLVLLDIASGKLRELTTSGHTGGIDWSPDGKRLVYGINRNGTMRLEWLAVEGDLVPRMIGTGKPGTVLGGSGFLFPTWAPDGRRVLYQVNSESGQHDLMMTAPDSGAAESSLVRSPASLTRPIVSPDGRWLGYLSAESGRNQLYVQRFPDGGSRVIVSLDGAGTFFWGRTGSTLNYQAPDGWIYTAHIESGDTPRVVGRERLLDVRDYVQWAPFPDGRRFLLMRRATPSDSWRVTLTLDWALGLSGR